MKPKLLSTTMLRTFVSFAWRLLVVGLCGYLTFVLWAFLVSTVGFGQLGLPESFCYNIIDLARVLLLASVFWVALWWNTPAVQPIPQEPPQ